MLAGFFVNFVQFSYFKNKMSELKVKHTMSHMAYMGHKNICWYLEYGSNNVLSDVISYIF